ncbi:effector-associated domain EAD1-containing protein [Frateuria sp. GZRR33]|uniref:GAP1-N1 domain-containing protein n=1 Tax=Frateuria sp. GZRR33 TaxID=3351535 RepID=UPI003EDCAAC6
MRVEQAVYGEIEGRGHGLRWSSTDAPIATTVASRLDLPDTVPPSVQAWSPFVRGFPIDNYYVIARTFVDPEASRGGMVLTHALIAALDDVSELGCLAGLFERLARSVADCSASREALELETPCSAHTPAAELVGAANALASTGLAPVVRLGVDEFESVIDSLWRNLWPSLRRTFAFRLSFGPNDLVERPTPLLVCTPEQLQARWTKYRTVQRDDQDPNSECARILSGRRDVHHILTLAKSLSLEICTLRELGRFEQLHALLAGNESLVDLLTAIRLVDGLSVQPAHGAEVKDQLLARSARLIPGAGCRQLLQMRNLALVGFANTHRLWSAVERLVSGLEFASADDGDLIEIVRTLADEELAVPQWRGAVTAGLLAAASRDERAIFPAIWRWAGRSQDAFATVLGILPADAEVEQQLADALPRKFKAGALDDLCSCLLQKNWLNAHGAVLASSLSPLDATKKQLGVDRNPRHSAGLRSALRYATPQEMLLCTLTHKDLRLIELCADVAADHPQILSALRCDDLTEQQLWAAAMKRKSALWDAPENAVAVRDNLLDQLNKGRPVDASLIEALSQTPLADLSSNPQRAKLWSLLPSQRDRYLQATANGWLDMAAKGVAVAPPEAPLEGVILAHGSLSSTLGSSSVTLDARLKIIGALPSFQEQAFISWLRDLLERDRNLHPADAEQMGALVSSRHWARVASCLAEYKSAHRRSDLMPALRLCADLLGFTMCWLLGISKPSAAEKWIAFESEVCELYPSGPDSGEIWSRAGGKNSELPGISQNGAARWHGALHQIRYGGRPTARELLTVMCKDFPGNYKLRLYASDPDIVSWR